MAKTPTPTPTPSTGKGHATPKRKDREAERHRPLVLDRKADSAKRRAERNAQLDRERTAMMTGDERNMPSNHAGPERRFARDYIDSRTTVGEFLLPATIIGLIALMFSERFPVVYAATLLALMLMMAAWVIESIIILGRLRKKAIAKFGESKIPRMFRLYGFTRMTQFRRLRLPKPQVKRGAYPI